MYKFLCLFVFLVLAVVTLSDAQHRGRRRWRGRHHFGRHTPRGNLFNRGGRGFRYHFGFSGYSPLIDFSFTTNHGGSASWWEGPNVCHVRTDNNATNDENEGSISHDIFSSRESCDITDTVYRCTQTISVAEGTFRRTDVRECCRGYTRQASDFGCPTATVLKNLSETITDLGLNQFKNALASVNLLGQIDNGNFTLFAPVDEGFEDLASILSPSSSVDLAGSVIVLSNAISSELTSNMAAALLGHTSLDVLPTSRLQDEQLIDTGSPTDSKIRFNTYRVNNNRILTANCRRISSADNVAENGIIHVVDKLIPSVTASLMDIIRVNPDLSFMKTAIGRAGIRQMLSDDGQLTVFAPTNTAFLQLDTALRERLLAGGPCLEKLVQNHILPNVICSSAIQGRVRSENLLQKDLHFNRDEDNKLFVGDAQIVNRDIMATNGVLHLIDDVLVLNEALGLLDLVERENATSVLGLIRQAGLEETLENAENVTFFVPTDEAIASLGEEERTALTQNPELLRDVLTYHLVPSIESVAVPGELETLNTGKKINLISDRWSEGFAYSLFPNWLGSSHPSITVMCARIVKPDVCGCNGRLHFIEKVLMPPAGNVVDVLEMDSRFSDFVYLMKTSGLADDLQTTGPFTVFAPTNEALTTMMAELRELGRVNANRLKRYLQTYVTNGFVCCINFRYRSYSSINNRVVMMSNRHGLRRVGGAEISGCNTPGTNGLVHTIDGLIRQGRYHF